VKWLAALTLAACGDTAMQPPACDPAACAANGQLCEVAGSAADTCVDPWHYGSPQWSSCATDPRATSESLAQKAAIYDQRAIALHVHPQMPWVLDVQLAAGVDPELATSADVAAWRSGENDGLWSALVLAAEAYRYAATDVGSAARDAARAALATLLHGEQLRMQITGVPGLMTRQLIPPGVTGIACPTDPARYVPSPDKTSNQWVRISAAGCVETADANGAFHATTHCGLAAFASWCFLDNVSQDEYSGHVFALGAVARLVDDPALRALAIDLLDQIGTHLVANGMQFVDWDGRATQYGKLYPTAGGDTPGYLAVLGASFLVTASRGTGDAALANAYASLAPVNATQLDHIDIWSGPDACMSNWNDVSMLTAAFHHLLWNDSAASRTPFSEAFVAELVATGKPITHQHNAWYDVMWAAMKPLGPGTDGPAFDAVADAACQLRQFPRSNHLVAHDTAPLAPEACTGRQAESMAATAFDIADRCAATYVWWGNSYIRGACTTDVTLVQNPAGYLLPYWMARYYGFIAASD
jgi:hypothetical protein